MGENVHTKGALFLMRRLFFLIACLVLCAAALPAGAEVIPSSAYNEGFYTFTGIYAQDAVVLCQRLSVRTEPRLDAPVAAELAAGDPFVTDKSQEGWLHAIYSDGALEGWVRQEYVLLCPGYLVLEAQTPAFAYSGAAAPRVALLEKDTRLPIIHSTVGWYVVSLRGASAWIAREADKIE